MLTHYLAISLRNVRRAPAAFAVNVVTLALGLVCFVTAYAFVAFWDRADRHLPDYERIYLLTMQSVYRDFPLPFTPEFGTSVPVQAAEYLREDYPALEKVARAMTLDREAMIASDTASARVFGVAVDPEFLDLFPLPFVAGSAGTALASPGSVVLTSDTARRLFGGAEPLGQRVILANSVGATVTGVIGPVPEPSHLGHTTNAVLPFDFLTSVDVRELYRAATMDAQVIKFIAGRWGTDSGITYLKFPASGLSARSLRNQLADFAARHVPAEALKQASYEFGMTRVDELLGRGNFQRTGFSFGAVLFALASLVLGVACLNYANLATARAARRAREIGVRKALGAKPTQVAAQSLVDAGVLTAAALVAAVIVFLLSGPVMEDLLRVDLAPTLFASSGVWLFLAAVVAGVTFVAGFYPAVVLARVRPANAIAAADVRLGSKFFSTLLVGTQFAVASALLLAVLILALQNAQTRRSGLGLTEDPLLVIENESRITKVEPATLRAELERLPQVTGVTEVSAVPWEMTMLQSFRDSPDPNAPRRPVIIRGVGEGFFDLFGIRLVAGRLLGGEHTEDLPPPPRPPPTADEPSSAAPGVEGSTPPQPQPQTQPRQVNVVVDAEFVELFLGLDSPQDAIGKIFYPPGDPANPNQPTITYVVVGVVDNRLFSYMTFRETRGVSYTLQRALDTMVARIDRNNVSGALAAIDARWRELAPNVPLKRRFLDDVFNAAFEYYERLNRLFGVLALMAVAISTAGLFGMATLVAARRRQEIGVRKTFGATTAQIVRLLLASFSKPVMIANVLVWPFVFFGARAYLKQFAEPLPLTPLPFAAALLITLAIAWLAVGSQTWRAARRKPAVVLRHES